MQQTALSLFDSVKKYSDIERMIQDGESENIYIECKNPQKPSLDKSLTMELSRIVSAFSNTEGGIIIWGVHTERHGTSNIDIFKKIDSIATVNNFKKILDINVPIITTPSITKFQNKVIKKKENDSNGVVVTYIPKANTPVQSIKDHVFYFRTGEGEIPLPYEVLHRMFVGSQSPEIVPILNPKIATLDQVSKNWRIPILIANESLVVAEHVKIIIEFLTTDRCDFLAPSRPLFDQSVINPGKRIFIANIDGVIHKGLNETAGEITLKMKDKNRVVKFRMSVLSKHMIPRSWEIMLLFSKLRYVYKIKNVNFDD